MYVGTSERTQLVSVCLSNRDVSATLDHYAYTVVKDKGASTRHRLVPLKAPNWWMAGLPSYAQAHDLDAFAASNSQRLTSAGPAWPTSYQTMEALDEDMLRSILVNVSKPDRYDAPIQRNTLTAAAVDMLPQTTDISAELDVRGVAVLESKQQRDAILIALDFRAALRTLIDEEQFTNHDLTQLIGVTRAVLVTWRERPLEKIRHVNQAAMGRLLFAWKYWLHITEGELLGRYLRHVPAQSATSLLRLLSDHAPSDEEIARHVDRLAVYATLDRKAAAVRRRDLGGLPSGTDQKSLTFD